MAGVGAGPYVLDAAALAALALSLGFSAVRLRRRLLPGWEGAPAHLVDAVLAVALLTWLGELLGVLNLLYAGTLVASALLLAAAVALGLWVLSRGKGAGRAPSALSAGGSAPPTGGAPAGGSQPGDAGTSPAGGGRGGGAWPGEATSPPFPSDRTRGPGPPLPHDRTRGPEPMSLVAIAVVAVVFAHWGLTAKDALGRGVFNFDSLWYHLPFAVEMAHSHSVTGIHHTETVFTNWFYPQSSELLHSVGILLTGRDTLSLFLNFGWLAIAFLAAWCIGRPYGRGPLTVVAAAIVLECHTLVVREPGAAKNDLMAAALLLAAIAILVNRETLLPRVARGRGLPGRVRRPVFRTDHSARETSRKAKNPAHEGAAPSPTTGPAGQMPPLAVAGLATGLAVGTKSTALAMAAALTLAVIVLAPAGRRRAVAGWWFVPALAGGGFWYVRNLIVAGNPLPQLERLGPIALPHPERLQSGRPDFSIAHYATDTAVWREYFGPGLEHAFGTLWPLVVGGAIAGGLMALLRGRDRVVRWMGGVALFGLLAYVFTPLSAAGAEGAPIGFAINIRYAIPALLAGLTLLPLVATGRPAPAADATAAGSQPGDTDTSPAGSADIPPAGGVGEGSRGGAASCFPPHPRSRTAGRLRGGKPSPGPGPLPRDRTRGPNALSRVDWALLGALLAVLVVTDRPDAVLRDPDRLFGWLVAALAVLIPAALILARRRGAPRGAIAGGFAALAIAAAAIGYPVQRDYLRDRFGNENPDTSIPGMHLDSAYRWARDVRGARIGLAGTTAGFLQYGLYGTDLSNRVRYLGVKGPHGAFNAIPDCRRFREAVNAADLDYLVTAPFLNFISPSRPVHSPEAGWLRGETAVEPIDRSGPVTVWRIDGSLDPGACGPVNAPLRRIPQQPSPPMGR